MATYNNKHWLLSHIRNSFISTDDTGMCEAVMLSDDLPSKCIENYKKKREPSASTSTTSTAVSKRLSNRPSEDFEWYPGLDQSDDEDLDPLSQSYDIQMDQDYGFGKHTAIAQKLEKVDQAKRRAVRIKSIKCDDNIPIMTEAEVTELFPRKLNFNSSNEKNGGAEESLLAQKLEEMRRQPTNKYQSFARFDGSQMSVPTKMFKIFLTMLPIEQRNYPMDVCVIATAKIQEFIGLICYKCSIAYSDFELQAVQNYGLYITEADGEIDDFPPLDLREPCSKFRFSHLAFVECKPSESQINRQERQMSVPSDNENDSIKQSNYVEFSNLANNPQDLERMHGHTQMMEAPLYRSYRVKMFTKGLFKTDIQLGISGEKLEIDPVQPQNTKFWTKQKPISHSMESVVSVDVEETHRSRVVVRIVYSTTAANETMASTTHDGSPTFRHYDFVTNSVLANEIVEKINNIIEVRSSATRREYLSRHPNASKKKKISFSFKT